MGRESLSASFARVVKRERLARGLSQETLAHRAGLHRTYVGLVERGLRKPSIEVGHALGRALGTPLSEPIWRGRETAESWRVVRGTSCLSRSHPLVSQKHPNLDELQCSILRRICSM